MSRWLEDHGIRQDGISPDGIGHRFRGRGLVVDVLAPDHMGARATLTTVGPARTVQVPSGRRLLASVQRTPVDCGDQVARVPRPDLAAAIVGKAAAQALPSPERHRLDLVFLLGLIDDITSIDAALSARDRRKLATAAHLLDEDRVWRATRRPADAQAALRYLIR